MKRIVLKPVISLLEGETYLIDNEECTYLGYGETTSQLEFRGKTSGRFWILDSNIKDIIESPEEPSVKNYECHSHANHKTFSHVFCKDGDPHDFETHTADEGTSYYGACKKCGYDPNKPCEVAETVKAIEEKSDCDHPLESVCKKCMNNGIHSRPIFECQPDLKKPPIKLRVGGVYKNFQEEFVKIVARTTDDSNPFVSENGDTYQEDGRYLDRKENSEFDLIEEVQPDQEKETVIAKNEVLVWCKTCKDVQNMSMEHIKSTQSLMCNKCRNKNVDTITKEKEAVEYCECDKSNSAVWLTSYEKKSNKYFCGKCRKEFVMPTHKPEGNPFKVGETVEAFYTTENGHLGQVIGVVKEIDGKKLWLKLSDCSSWVPYHYKQCERVNDNQ